jgi:quercetin dioxygenase-like cupin family protein
MRLIPVLLLLTATISAQQKSAIPVDQEPHHHQVLQNSHVRAFLSELAPNELMPAHLHARDYITVFLLNAQLTVTAAGQKPLPQRFAAGNVRYTRAPVIHSVRNTAPAAFRAVEIEFTEQQGKSTPSKQAASHYCNAGSKTACVDEKYLFCTDKVCLSDVTLGEGAITTKHSHATDHMLVALTDYRLSDNVEGKGTNVRVQQSGGVEYIPAGITHQLTNVAQHPVRFLVIVFR